MSTGHPPSSLMNGARKRNQKGREARTPAVITLDGEDYRGAARIFAARPEIGPGGWKQVQRFVCWIPKSLLVDAPNEKSHCVINGYGFRVNEIAGYNATDTEWVIKGQRTPGRDE